MKSLMYRNILMALLAFLGLGKKSKTETDKYEPLKVQFTI